MKLWSFIDEVCLTLSGHGIKVDMSRSDGPVLLSAEGAGGHNAGFILTDPISADPSAAIEESVRIGHLCNDLDNRPMIIVRDLWEREKDMMQARILAHCGICRRIFARNCEVRRIGRPEANSFLGKSHSYGGASCRYCYGLYVRRYTGSSSLTVSRRCPGGSCGILECKEMGQGRQNDKVIRMDKICLDARPENQRRHGQDPAKIH